MEDTNKRKVSLVRLSSRFIALLNLSANETKAKETSSSALKVYNSLIKPELQHLRIVSEYYKEAADFTWTVSDIHTFVDGSQKKLLSEVFHLTSYPFGAQIKMKMEAKSIKFSMSYKNMDRNDAPLRLKPIPNIYLTIKDQQNSNQNKDIIRTGYYSSRAEYDNFFNVYYVSKSALTSPPYILDDKWAIAIHVEAPEVARAVYSHDGILIWAIDDFSERKQMEVEGLIESHLSPYFYTGPNGYRMQVELCLNGINECRGKGVAAFVSVLNGLYDDDVVEECQLRMTVTVFHPKQPQKSISKSLTRVSRNSGDMFYIGSHADVERLLYRDTLYYKVIVKTI